MNLFSKLFGKKSSSDVRKDYSSSSSKSIDAQVPEVIIGSDRKLQLEWAKNLFMQRQTGAIKPILIALKNSNPSILEKMSTVLSELASDADSIKAFSTHLKDTMEIFLLIGVLKEMAEKDPVKSVREKAGDAWMNIARCAS